MARIVSFIDVHKKMLAVVVGDAGKDEKVHFMRRKFGAGAGDCAACAEFCPSWGCRKSAWSPRRNTGNRPGESWRKHNRTADREDGNRARACV